MACWKIVNSIIDQIDSQPNSEEIRKLLYYKLMMGMSFERFDKVIKREASTPDMVDFTGGT